MWLGTTSSCVGCTKQNRVRDPPALLKPGEQGQAPVPLGRQLRQGAEPLITSLPESITAPPGALKWRNFGSRQGGRKSIAG